MGKKRKKQSTCVTVAVSIGVFLCAFLMCSGFVSQLFGGGGAKHTPTRTPYVALASPTQYMIEEIIPPIYPTPHFNNRQTQVSTAISPTALCRDGQLSYSATRSGTCSHHGGVAQWYK
jgi:hypothetical protein